MNIENQFRKRNPSRLFSLVFVFVAGTLCVILLIYIGMQLVTSAHAQPVAQRPFMGTLHELLVATIKRNRVEAFMTGDIANRMNQELKTTGSVEVTAHIVERFKNPDCARVAIVFTKRNVATPIGITDANLRTQMNYCLDGSPPGDQDK